MAHADIHPLFKEAVSATHSRPALPVRAPSIVDNAIVLIGEGSSDFDRDQVLNVLKPETGWSVERDASGEFVAMNGSAALKWERHTEFLSLTLIREGELERQSSDISVDALLPIFIPKPAEPIGEHGQVFCRTTIHIEVGEGTPDRGVAVADDPTHSNAIKPDKIRVVTKGGAIELETSLLHDETDAVHYNARIVQSRIGSVQANRVGRFVQAILEIESYRLLAYLAVPVMRDTGQRVAQLEARVNEIALIASKDPGPAEEAQILTELTSLSAELQAIASAAEFRFAASLAYAAIVDERLNGMREERVEGHQRLSTAIKRRLDPAMLSARALLTRQQQISARIGTITELLRTRVDLKLQDQNAKVLRSIDQRANAQLRLQRAVEGLSVAAITYYMLGILSYLVNGTPWEGLGLTPNLIQAALVLPIVFLVFFGVRRARKQAEAQLSDIDSLP
ncbi:MAG: DUF3422 domain-containing protein [Pseudomonadota bacterium]